MRVYRDVMIMCLTMLWRVNRGVIVLWLTMLRRFLRHDIVMLLEMLRWEFRDVMVLWLTLLLRVYGDVIVWLTMLWRLLRPDVIIVWLTVMTGLSRRHSYVIDNVLTGVRWRNEDAAIWVIWMTRIHQPLLCRQEKFEENSFLFLKIIRRNILSFFFGNNKPFKLKEWHVVTYITISSTTIIRVPKVLSVVTLPLFHEWDFIYPFLSRF
jgi:hypothetical protein